MVRLLAAALYGAAAVQSINDAALRSRAPWVDSPLPTTDIVENDTSVSLFPTDEWVEFLANRVRLPHSPTVAIDAQETSLAATNLARALFKCTAADDGRCAAALGDMYYEGIVAAAVEPAEFRSSEAGGTWIKSHRKALQLWWQGSLKGDREALYRLGVFYSTFPNAPTLNYTKRAAHVELDRPTGTDVLKEIIGRGSAESFDRWILTMQILDLPAGSPSAALFEAELTAWWLNSQGFAVEIDAISRIDCLNGLQECLLRWPLKLREDLAVLYLYAAAQAGHIGANLALGFRHMYGNGVPQRCLAAANFYGRVASATANISTYGIPPAAELIRLNVPSGEMAGAASSQSTLAALQLHLAESKSPQLEVSIAKKYLLGTDGLPRDPFKALHYFASAANAKDSVALAYLGYMSALGLGVERDFTIAEKCLKRSVTAAAEGMAYNGLGWLYFTGNARDGVNLDQALRYFNLSASKGFADGQFNLAVLYITGEGVSKSYALAAQYLMKAVEQGHSGAAYVLGLMHMNGLGVVKDCHFGVSLFKRVAERHPWVTETVKRAYALQSRKQWDGSAVDYWQAAEAGVEVAQSNLAQLLDGGGIRPLKPLESTISLIWRAARGSRSSVVQRHLMPEFHANRGRDFLELLRGVFRWFGGSSVVDTAKIFVPEDNSDSVTRGIQQVLAHRYWCLAAQQLSTNALVRVGDYAWYGHGLEPARKNDPRGAKLSAAEISSLTGTQSIVEEQPLTDNEGVALDGWAAVPKESVLFKRIAPDFSLAYTVYESASMLEVNRNELPAKVASAIARSISKADFSLALLAHFDGRWSMARKHIARAGSRGRALALATKIAMVVVTADAAFSVIKKKGLKTFLLVEPRLIVLSSFAATLALLLLARSFAAKRAATMAQ